MWGGARCSHLSNERERTELECTRNHLANEEKNYYKRFQIEFLRALSMLLLELASALATRALLYLVSRPTHLAPPSPCPLTLLLPVATFMHTQNHL